MISRATLITQTQLSSQQLSPIRGFFPVSSGGVQFWRFMLQSRVYAELYMVKLANVSMGIVYKELYQG